jgi:murein DD-endopeptidase MepM/ murein hydrolase activator NlpD
MRGTAVILIVGYFLALAGGLAAQPLPPALTQLQAAITQAQAALTATQGRQATLAKQHQQQTAQLHQQLTTLLQLQRLPTPYMAWQAVQRPHTPPLGSLLAYGAKHQSTNLQQLSTQLSTYLSTISQAQQQLATLTQLQQTWSQGRHQLQKVQSSALSQATLSAQGLATSLQHFTTTPPMPASSLQHTPVAGHLVAGSHPDGLTFSATPGSTVSSLTPGYVVYSGPFQRFGGLVILRAPTGHYLLYAQLATLAVTAGQSVSAGQALGTLPNTAPAQLFFQVRRRGSLVNAQHYLASIP